MSRSVLITGCSSGIGLACARRFAEAGLRVFATARRVESLGALAAIGCETRTLDVTDPADAERVVAEIEAREGGVDVLVNNAGHGQQGAFETLPLSAFRAQLETNLIGAIGLTQRVLPRMRARGRGRILMMSSMGGRLAFPGGAAYHASKYALEAASDVLRFEVAGFGIAVVIVEPGLVASEFGRTALARLEQGGRGEVDAAYDRFNTGLRAALTRSFAEDAPGATTADEVARACVAAALADQPPTRVVVGALAEQLLRTRASATDEAWDALLESMYPRPRPE